LAITVAQRPGGKMSAAAPPRPPFLPQKAAGLDSLFSVSPLSIAMRFLKHIPTKLVIYFFPVPPQVVQIQTGKQINGVIPGHVNPAKEPPLGRRG